MDGQAQAPESGIQELAEYLTDSPEEESEQGEAAPDDSPVEDTESDGEPQTDEADESEEESQDDTDEPEAKPTPEALTEVTVKDKDGNDVVEKVTQTELKNGYIRQAKFTASMQGLAERETQAVQVFQQKHGELRNDYLQKTEFATQAIARLAGFRSADEMAQLAAEDLSSWVRENHRQTQIREILGTLEQQTQAERLNAAQQQQQLTDSQLKMVKERSWIELQKDGFDRPKLQKTYESVMKGYGYEPKDFANVTDYRLVRMMADAVKYRELQAKAPSVTQKAKDAPQAPRKQQPNDAKLSNAQAERFTQKRARLSDLAAYFT